MINQSKVGLIGSEAQLRLASAGQGPAGAGGDLVRIEDVTERSAHDARPASESNDIDRDNLNDSPLAICVAGVEQMQADRDDGNSDLDVKVKT